jgi:hypothetical protein
MGRSSRQTATWVKVSSGKKRRKKAVRDATLIILSTQRHHALRICAARYSSVQFLSIRPLPLRPPLSANGCPARRPEAGTQVSLKVASSSECCVVRHDTENTVAKWPDLLNSRPVREEVVTYVKLS